MFDDTGTLRVSVYLRDLDPVTGPSQSSVLSRLYRLADGGRIDELSVEAWGKQVVLDRDPSPTVGERDLDTLLEEFESWASRNGHSLAPAFRRRELTTPVSEDSTEVVTLPVICVAVYENDALRAVFPCTSDDGTRTVEDCLSQFESVFRPMLGNEPASDV